MPKTAAQKYWTKTRVERLSMWYSRYGSNRGTFAKIATHFKGKSPNSIYKKLGRMGILPADWSLNQG